MPIISHLQDVKTDTTAIDVNVWVITRGVKLDRRRCHGVIWWEVNRNLELQPSVDLVHRGSERSIHHVTRRQDERRTYCACRTLDRSHPVKQIRVRPRERGLRVTCTLRVEYNSTSASEHSRFQARKTSVVLFSTAAHYMDSIHDTHHQRHKLVAQSVNPAFTDGPTTVYIHNHAPFRHTSSRVSSRARHRRLGGCPGSKR